MTLIPFTARLAPKEEEIDATTTVDRIRKHFPSAEVDWQRGDEEVYRGIARLQEMDMPDCYLEAKRRSLGQVAYISLRDERYPGLTAWFYASHIERELGECFDLYTDPEINIPFLKYLATAIGSQLDFGYLFTTDLTWGIDIRSEPQRLAPYEYARNRLPERNYPELSIRPLDDWRASLLRAIPQWFEQSKHKNKQKMIDRVGSVAAVAADTVDALMQIDDDHDGWLVEIPAPFSNGLIVEHESWMSYVSLSGAPKGILA